MKLVLIILLVLYPAMYAACFLIYHLKRRKFSPEPSADYVPKFSIIISSSGEPEDALRRKLLNTIALDYPVDRVEVILFSDGLELPGSLQPDFPRVLLINFPKLGKTECQNRCLRIARNEIIVSTDVTALLRADTLRKCGRWYGDRRVGAVSGEFKYDFEKGNPEDDYIAYEMKKKVQQSAFGLVIGYLGPFYSVRKELSEELPDFYQSDYAVPLMTAVRGAASIIDPEIVVERSLDRQVGKEYDRKRRIVAQGIATTLHFSVHNFAALFARPDLLSAILFYKLLRWLMLPYICLIGAAGLLTAPRIGAALLIIGCGAALIGRNADRSGARAKWIKAPYYAALLVSANIGALVDVLRGNVYRYWSPGSR